MSKGSELTTQAMAATPDANNWEEKLSPFSFTIALQSSERKRE